MLKGLPLKRNQVFFIAAFLLLAIILAAWFFFFQKKDKQHPDFISANLSEADSLISTMSLEEKISRLFIVKADDQKLVRLWQEEGIFRPGALLLPGSTASPFLNDYLLASCKNPLRPLRFATEFELHAFHWHTDSCREMLLHKNQMFVLSDTALLSAAMTYEMLDNKKYGVDVWVAPGLKNFTDHNKIYNFFRKEKILLSTVVSGPVSCRLKKDTVTGALPAVLLLEKDSLQEQEDGKPAWLSACLRQKLDFNGIIASRVPQQQLANAIKESGSDLFFTDDFLAASGWVQSLVKDKKLAEKHIDRRLRKIISVMLWRDEQQRKRVAMSDSLTRRLARNRMHVVDQVRRNSSVLWSNPRRLLPINQAMPEIQLLDMGVRNQVFNTQLLLFSEIDERKFSMQQLEKSEKIKLLCLNSNVLEQTGGKSFMQKLDSISKGRKLIVVCFSEKQSLSYVPQNFSLLQVIGGEPDDYRYAAQAIFGAQVVSGRPAKDARNKKYRPLQIKKSRLGYVRPEVMKLDTSMLARIDSLAEDAIARGAFPGCQVFFAYKGDVVFNKSYGHHTYARKRAVRNTDVYDLASITKVAATTLAAMKLVEQGKLDLDEELGEYFRDTHIEYTRIKPDTVIRIDTLSIREIKELERKIRKCDTTEINDSTAVLIDTMLYKATPKQNIFKCKMRDLLIHKSGLPPSLPILRYLLYRNDTVLRLPATFILDRDSVITIDTLRNRADSLRYLWLKYYNNKRLKDTSDRRIARGMYLRREYCDTLWMDIKQTRVYSRDVYMYSDLNAVLAQITIDSITEKPLSSYVYRRFYKPMGLVDMGFNPRYSLDNNRIVPTERDKFWRRQLLLGDVHDPSAALMGGVAGNAGLFSSAQDLGTLFQMFLQEGTYGGRRYLSPSVIRMFTAQQKRSHRGLGFDRVNSRNIAAGSAPANSYGHTGFTGTCVWVDPEHEIVFVFLSNRVHPSARNWRINKYNVRQNIHQAFYDAVME